MISLPRQHASCSSKKSFRFPGHRWLASACSHTVDNDPHHDSWIRKCRKSKLFRHGLAQPIFGSSYKNVAVISGGIVDSGDLHRIACKCAGTGGRCSVSGENSFIHAQSFAPQLRQRIDLAHICESMMDAVHAAVFGSACAGLELDAGSGHNVRSSNVCSVGDTR